MRAAGAYYRTLLLKLFGTRNAAVLNIRTEIKADGMNRLAPLIAGILGVFVLYLRTPSGFISPQFWAEDGVIFWYQHAVWGWKLSSCRMSVTTSSHQGWSLPYPRYSIRPMLPCCSL